MFSESGFFDAPIINSKIPVITPSESNASSDDVSNVHDDLTNEELDSFAMDDFGFDKVELGAFIDFASHDFFDMSDSAMGSSDAEGEITLVNTKEEKHEGILSEKHKRLRSCDTSGPGPDANSGLVKKTNSATAKLNTFPHLYIKHMNAGNLNSLEAILKIICHDKVTYRLLDRSGVEERGGQGVDFIIKHHQAQLDAVPDAIFSLLNYIGRKSYSNTYDIIEYNVESTGLVLWANYLKTVVGKIDLSKYIDPSLLRNYSDLVSGTEVVIVKVTSQSSTGDLEPLELSMESLQLSYDGFTKDSLKITFLRKLSFFIDKTTSKVQSITSVLTITEIIKISLK